MKSATIVAIILGILVVLSAVQAFQLNSMKTKVAEGELNVGSSTSTRPLSTDSGRSAPAAVPTSIQNLPQMVGGC